MGKLKVTEEHIQVLREELAPFLNGTTQAVYAEEGLSRTRYIWDALWSARRRSQRVRDTLDAIYTYGNDTHINSVLDMLAKERAHVEVSPTT